MRSLDSLATPAVLVDQPKLLANIRGLQAHCDAHHVALRPHMKTHKMLAVARAQLAAGARGLTCAKLGEAEAMLPSGVREIFLAHSLADPHQAPRITALCDQLSDFRVAVTSELHLEALERVAAATHRRLGVMLALDTGLGREGVRSDSAALALAARLARHPNFELRGLYCHEGQFYGLPPTQLTATVDALLERIDRVRNSIDPQLPLWPGCSVTAHLLVSRAAGRVQAIRPGTYVFGDLSLTHTTGVMPAHAAAVQIMATVVDRPEPGLALIDAGSKTFSSDRTPNNVFGRAADGRDLDVVRVNEEHGYVRGTDVDRLRVGEKVPFIPAHICPAINLAREVVVTNGTSALETWTVDARGMNQ